MYHKDVPEKGGLVCYQDGKVVELTPEEFKQAPKAQVVSDTQK